MNSENRPFWDALKEAVGVKPNDVDGQDAWRTQTYRDYLLRLARGIIEIECPREWSKQYMKDLLIMEGVFCVADSPVGVFPFLCSPHGENVQYRPTRVTIANPAFSKTLDLLLGVEAELVYMVDDVFFHGIGDLIAVYAQKLANCDSAIDVNLINTKDSKVYGVEDKRTAQSIRAMHDQIMRGEPAVFIKKSLAKQIGDKDVEIWTSRIKENYIAGDVQIEKRRIIEEFLTMLGIDNANTDKRERLNADEVNSNNEELKCNIDFWRENLKNCTENVNRLFPRIPFKVGIRDYTGKNLQKEGEKNADLA